VLLVFGVLRADASQDSGGGSGTNDAPSAASTTNAPSKFRDPIDGWLDVSEFLDTAYGFMPIASPITEPAVGYGASGGLMFINRKEPVPGARPEKPNLTAVGGLGTENGTWGVFGGNFSSWMDGKLETLASAVYASANLDFYGIGDNALRDHPLRYNLEPLGTTLEGHYRLDESSWQAGLSYMFFISKVSFDSGGLPPQVTPRELDSRVAGFSPAIIYDTRNNFFTPTKGVYARAEVGIFNEAVGGSYNFEKVNLTYIYYHPLTSTLSLGVRAEGKASFDDVPFYMRPSISLRGVQAMRYMGEHAAEVELEARWQFWKRWSMVGFTGAGVAWNNFDRLQNDTKVVAGGVGFRYEIARKHGLHMGIDVAFGPNSPVIYIQMGSAWFRP
jgi:hypothetical protein